MEYETDLVRQQEQDVIGWLRPVGSEKQSTNDVPSCSLAHRADTLR